MKNDLISIIIPVYKVEKYLEKCIESVLKQTYTNLQIILVDDGSPDNCGKICDEYAKKDSRIEVIHKINGGLSDARNVGINRANGRYIGFVDSDDYIKEDMYEKLINLIKEYDADISICNLYDVIDGKEYVRNKDNGIHEYSRIDILKEILLDKNIQSYAWNKLCKRELFDTIRFPVGRVMEDLGIAHKILFDAGQIAYSDEPLYYYYQRDGSTLHTDCIKFFQDRLAMVTERYLFLEKLYPDMLENDAYFVDMALNDYPILYRSALDPESDQLIRHAYQKSRSILSFYNKMRFAFFSRSKALYYFIERRNCNLARYDNC